MLIQWYRFSIAKIFTGYHLYDLIVFKLNWYFCTSVIEGRVCFAGIYYYHNVREGNNIIWLRIQSAYEQIAITKTNNFVCKEKMQRLKSWEVKPFKHCLFYISSLPPISQRQRRKMEWVSSLNLFCKRSCQLLLTVIFHWNGWRQTEGQNICFTYLAFLPLKEDSVALFQLISVIWSAFY